LAAQGIDEGVETKQHAKAKSSLQSGIRILAVDDFSLESGSMQKLCV